MKSVGQIFRFSFLKTFTAIVFSIFGLTFPTVFAQFHETFSDNEIFSDPEWIGDIDQFTVHDGILQLNGSPGTTSAWLASNNAGVHGTWDFWVRLAFNPSAANYLRIYLTASVPELMEPLKGYFVMIGGTADEVSLYRQSGTTKTRIIDGLDGRVNLNDVSIHIKATCSSDGVWQLFSKLSTEQEYVLEGTAVDHTFTTSAYFGFQCSYTSTRADKFFFDDILVDTQPVIDVTPPAIESLEVLNAHQLRLSFTEPLQAAASNTTLYSVSENIGSPQTAELHTENTVVMLSFVNPFINGKTYTLNINPVTDLSGNNSLAVAKHFVYAEPVDAHHKEVVITEIFADPTPPVGLPEAEFVELFNRSDKVFNLAGWTLSDERSKGKVGSYNLLPGEYLILTPPAAVSSFSSFGAVLGISGFPSLNNAGDAVILKDGNGITIDSVSYSDKWYKDSSKKAGGWTLELIDPENLCAEVENWVASEDDMGGIPGRRNSVFAQKSDLTGPVLIQAMLLSPDTLVLLFNKKLESKAPAENSFNLPEGHVVQKTILHSNKKGVSLVVYPPFKPGTFYAIEAVRIFDCAGNAIQSSFGRANFAIPEVADSLDVVINEILFNPRVNGSDFLEILNCSKKFIDLKDWKIAQCENSGIKNAKSITDKTVLLEPGRIIAFTPDVENILNEYPRSLGEHLFEMILPAFNDRSGSACLIGPDGKLIDKLFYHDGMHSKFVRDKEGVSLERISTNIATSDAMNWKSASSSEGFATPGYQNSNAMPDHHDAQLIRIDPETFIPAHGNPDFTKIEYSFDQGNYMANIRIFDPQGRLIKTVASNEMLGSTGFFRWEGDCDDGTKARIGSYMVRVELYNSAGVVKTLLKRVAIAGRF